ncbi:MAG: hypothetical protein R3F30_04410 [Planctomycetota bacterium]
MIGRPLASEGTPLLPLQPVPIDVTTDCVLDRNVRVRFNAA